MENWDTHSWSLTHSEFGKVNLKAKELMVRIVRTFTKLMINLLSIKIHFKKSCTCNQLYQISTQIKKKW